MSIKDHETIVKYDLERFKSWREEHRNCELDLSGADLSGVDLQGKDLSKAKLIETKLEGAILCGTILKDASLKDANLQGADLQGADLQGATGLTLDHQLDTARNWPLALYGEGALIKSLREKFKEPENFDDHNNRVTQGKYELGLAKYQLKGVNFTGADLAHFNLQEANLQEAQLAAANLQGAKLKNAQLRKASLQGAILKAAYLQTANLQDANLKDAQLPKANLRDANLQKTNLAGANLQGAHLEGAQLMKANLRSANLQKANLSWANLQGANLESAQLMKAEIQDANLQDALLQNANLQGADLTWSQLQRADLSSAGNDQDPSLANGGSMKKTVGGANLTRTILREASLEDANLRNTTGLLAEQLAGASVSGASLPLAIEEKFKYLGEVEEASKNARKLFFFLLLGCLYVLLTIATTTDVRLVTNSPSSPLPILNAKIPIVWFYMAGPFLLVGVFVVFCFYLQRLWERLAKLPAIFPDGTPLDEKAYPWLLIGLVRSHVKLLQEEDVVRRNTSPVLIELQNALYIGLAWGAVPITLLFIWFRYLYRHDWPVTVFHIALFALSVGIAVFFQQCATKKLKGLEGEASPQSQTVKWSGLLTVAMVLCLIVPSFFSLHLGVDLKNEEVSMKPEDWSASNRIDSVKGANLEGRDLRNGDLRGAFLVKADLKGADLRMANLQGANLQGADLTNARMKGANLEGGNLKGVKGLTQWQIEEASLEVSKLDASTFSTKKGMVDVEIETLNDSQIETSETKAQPRLTDTPSSKQGVVQVERETPNDPQIEISDEGPAPSHRHSFFKAGGGSG